MTRCDIADSPRDLIDEILVQLKKQQEHPEANPVLAQLSESHLNQILSDVFFGECSELFSWRKYSRLVEKAVNVCR